MAGHGSKKVIYAALAGNGLIAITKFIGASITGSSAMLSEAIHSVVDTGNQGLLLYLVKRHAGHGDIDPGQILGVAPAQKRWRAAKGVLERRSARIIAGERLINLMLRIFQAHVMMPF